MKSDNVNKKTNMLQNLEFIMMLIWKFTTNKRNNNNSKKQHWDSLQHEKYQFNLQETNCGRVLKHKKTITQDHNIKNKQG
jgi:hypothetical protein